MIEITYDPVRLRLKLAGHAGAGVPGQDLVCCAASILTYTLAANVRRMQNLGWLQSARLRLSAGDADIRCQPKKEHAEAVAGRMDAVTLGFCMLSREYPDFVRFQIETKEEENEKTA